jgi:circadian clock protein KaiC
MTEICNASSVAMPALPKCPTGIEGLDEVTRGGLPRGRSTLVCGSPGCGKTLLAAEFLVRGATEYGEPGVLMAFEETADELAANVRSLGFDVKELIDQKMLAVDYVYVERSEIEETGEYDLEGLFVRLGYAIDSLQAKRVVLDTIEVLFAGLSNAGILRAEIRRLFRWLKEKGVTAVITGERGNASLTRHGLEEYVSDCVILLDHRVTEQVSTRRLRIVKYRGSAHGTNEFPFVIDNDGLSVIPITSVGLEHPVSDERVSTGIPALDAMVGGKGVFRGSSVLISGSAGTGKTSIAGFFAASACGRGERALMFSFEEAPSQIVRNLRSIGLDLDRWIKQDMLRICSTRPSRYGLETHLGLIHKQVRDFRPQVVIVDPISNFISVGTQSEAGTMLVRLIDFLKAENITSLFTHLTHGGVGLQQTDEGISSIIDTWLLLRDTETDGERQANLSILKSRGMAHSKSIRSFRLSDNGIELN